jgi:hypothetical protein
VQVTNCPCFPSLSKLIKSLMMSKHSKFHTGCRFVKGFLLQSNQSCLIQHSMHSFGKVYLEQYTCYWQSNCGRNHFLCLIPKSFKIRKFHHPFTKFNTELTSKCLWVKWLRNTVSLERLHLNNLLYGWRSRETRIDKKYLCQCNIVDHS